MTVSASAGRESSIARYRARCGAVSIGRRAKSEASDESGDWYGVMKAKEMWW